MTTKVFFSKAFCKNYVVTWLPWPSTNSSLGAVHDGSRDWLTVAATMCADGTALAPLLIYQSDAGTIQDSWLRDFDLEEQDCFFSSSDSGWTSDEIGSKWLQELFDTRTAAKARRNWRSFPEPLRSFEKILLTSLSLPRRKPFSSMV